MPLIGAETVPGILRGYRTAWVAGRFSGGKTSLALLLARVFLEEGYRLVTNVRTVWADPLDRVRLLPGGHLKAVLLLDEGGLWLKSNRVVESIIAYAAKMDLIVLIPSFFPPAPRFGVVRIQPLFTFRHIGIPVTVYRWDVGVYRYHDRGFFAWVLPSRDGIYGVYSRQDPCDDPWPIVRWMEERLEEFRAFHGRSLSGAPSGSSVGSDASDVSELTDAITELRETWERVAERTTRKR